MLTKLAEETSAIVDAGRRNSEERTRNREGQKYLMGKKEGKMGYLRKKKASENVKKSMILIWKKEKNRKRKLKKIVLDFRNVFS